MDRISTASAGSAFRFQAQLRRFLTARRHFLRRNESSPCSRTTTTADGRVAVWIPAGPGAQADLIAEVPETYFRPPYVGVAGWVGVELSRVDDYQLGALIREAFRLMATKNSASGSSTSSKRRRARGGKQ